MMLRKLTRRQTDMETGIYSTLEEILYNSGGSQRARAPEEPWQDRQSILTQTSTATTKTQMTADVSTLADEIATRAVARGVHFGTDPSLTVGTIAVTHTNPPRYIPVRVKYDTGSDVNIISKEFAMEHDLGDLLNEIEGGGSQEDILLGLDDHEYRVRFTITLSWCAATMHKMRKTKFHVTDQLPYDLLLGNDFIQENSVLYVPRPALPLRLKRKTKGA